MPWTAEEFKTKHFKDASPAQAKKAAEIANAMLKDGAEEGAAIATAIKEAKKLAASGATGATIIAGLWGGEVTFSARMPVPPLDPPPTSRAAVGAAPENDGGGHARLDAPDSQGGKMEPGPRGERIAGKDGKAPLPRFNLSAYNGGPMRLAGFYHPVIVEAEGAEGAADMIPVYAGGHPPENATPAQLMDCLAGQCSISKADHRLEASGDITGTGMTVQRMMMAAANGYRFQNSIHGKPRSADDVIFLKAGETATVNGRLVAGPANVVRRSIIDHIAILPLGADTTTAAHIAASHAAGEPQMEKLAWIKAHYGLDEAAFSALPEAARNALGAAFDASTNPPENKSAKTPANVPDITASGAAAETQAIIKAQNDAVAANRKRIAAIDAIDGASQFPEITAQAISEMWAVDKTENVIIKAQRDQLTRSHATASPIGTPEFRASYPRVLEAATLLSCGYQGDLARDRRYGEKVANMTDDFYRAERSRVMTPSKVARIIARFNGVDLPDGHGDDFWGEALANERICPRGGERLISAEFSSISLPVALSNVMNKFMIDAYLSVDPNHADPVNKTQAWKHFTKVSSVQDFKPHYRIRMVATLLLQRLLKGGEIQHGTVGEQSYMLTADTKAIMLGLTRKDLINDDQSMLSALPTHFGIGAAQTVANDIYACLLNGYQSDGSTAFFTSSDITTVGNLMKANLTASAALAYATLDAARIRFANQTQPNGQPAGLLAEILLIPPGLLGTAQNLYKSSEVRDTTASTKYGVANILAGLFRPICSTYLANGAIDSLTGSAVSGSATTWYLVTPATANAYPIEIGFLNGTEIPIIERAEADFQRLGISFRTFLDYGVAMSEPRAVQKQTA